MNLLYEPDDGEIEYWSELTHGREKKASETERNRIIGIIKKRRDFHVAFIKYSLDAGVAPSEHLYAAIAELEAILREIEQ